MDKREERREGGRERRREMGREGKETQHNHLYSKELLVGIKESTYWYSTYVRL